MKTTWIILLSLALTAVNPRFVVAAEQPVPTNAKAVFQRHFEAVGGREAVLKLRSVIVEGTAQEGEQTFGFALHLKPPGLIGMMASNSAGLIVRSGRDARARCWRQDPRGVREIDGQDAGDFMDLAIGFLLPGQPGLFDHLLEAVCEPVTEAGRPAVAVGREGGAMTFPRMVFDAETGQLVRVGKTVFGDYRHVQGFMLPHTTRSEGPVRLEVQRIRLNEPIDASVFERPSKPTAMPESPVVQDLHTMLSEAGRLKIVRRPAVTDFQRGQLPALPVYRPESPRHAQVDLRGYDLKGLKLEGRLADLLHADFDSVTKWPADLPVGFDPDRVLSLGRDPGLGVRALHRRGIVGRGMGIGIIDQPLLVDHVEYRDRLKLYEEVHSPSNAPAQMHGPAVASIAVGKTCGVAPAADLYYVAEQHGTFKGEGSFDWDFTWLAQSIHRLLDVNQRLAAGSKLRVISVSVGWSPEQKGYAETMAAVERATREGVFVVSTAIETTHRLKFHGLGREVMSDPTEAASFGPGSWWAGMYWGGQQRFRPGERLLVPMDSRTTASPTGVDHYVFYYSAGWSWSVPWIAGLYALACEVKPDLTPASFWAEALATGRNIRVRRAPGMEELDFGTIVNPVALIERLQAKGSAAKAVGFQPYVEEREPSFVTEDRG